MLKLPLSSSSTRFPPRFALHLISLLGIVPIVHSPPSLNLLSGIDSAWTAYSYTLEARRAEIHPCLDVSTLDEPDCTPLVPVVNASASRSTFKCHGNGLLIGSWKRLEADNSFIVGKLELRPKAMLRVVENGTRVLRSVGAKSAVGGEKIKALDS